MNMLTVRVRHPGGSATVKVDGGESIASFLEAVSAVTGLAAPRVHIGGPPQSTVLDGDAPGPIGDLLKTGDSVRCDASPGDAAAAPSQPAAPAAAPARERPAEVAASPPAASSDCVPLSDGSACLVRRLIAADNSCLFTAVGYATERSHARARGLREVVATAVASNPELYTRDFLDGRTNAAYCEWIQLPSSWGGAIELSILSSALGVRICSGDIQTQRVDRYGEGEHEERILLLYDGLHYDAVVLSPAAGAPEEFDETRLRWDAPNAAATDAAFDSLLAAAHAQRAFTDTNKARAFVFLSGLHRPPLRLTRIFHSVCAPLRRVQRGADRPGGGGRACEGDRAHPLRRVLSRGAARGAALKILETFVKGFWGYLTFVFYLKFSPC